MKSIKKWWNSPITWGATCKMNLISMAVMGIVYAIAVTYNSWESFFNGVASWCGRLAKGTKNAYHAAYSEFDKIF